MCVFVCVYVCMCTKINKKSRYFNNKKYSSSELGASSEGQLVDSVYIRMDNI